jgi:hypothetical protein
MRVPQIVEIINKYFIPENVIFIAISFAEIRKA